MATQETNHGTDHLNHYETRRDYPASINYHSIVFAACGSKYSPNEMPIGGRCVSPEEEEAEGNELREILEG